MNYRIIYCISDTQKRLAIEKHLLSAGFQPFLPFSSMIVTLHEPFTVLKRKLKKLRNAYLLSPHDKFVVLRVNEAGKEEEEVGVV